MKVVLWIGDDVLVAIAPKIQREATRSGSQAYVYGTCGSTTKWWAHGGNIPTLVKLHKPDTVVFVLGENDPDEPDLEEHVRDLVAVAGRRLVVWIGPTQHARERIKCYKKVLGRRFADMSAVFAPGGDRGHLLAVDRYGHLLAPVFERVAGRQSYRKKLRVAWSSSFMGVVVAAYFIGSFLGWW